MLCATINTGERVKVIGVPPDLPDKNDLETRSLFEKCVGCEFEVMGLESVEGLRTPLIRLDVGSVFDKRSWEHHLD